LILLSASGNVGASYFESQVTQNASFTGSISQRLFQNYYLGLSAGYTHTGYRSSSASLVVSRTDEYYFVGVNLGTSFLKRGTASIFYSLSNNTSTDAGFAYTSDQIGFQLSYGY
jgi:hypothetical protein